MQTQFQKMPANDLDDVGLNLTRNVKVNGQANKQSRNARPHIH
jgi:hypothetical protein